MKDNGKRKIYIPKIEYVFPEKEDEQIIKVEEKRKVKLGEKYYDKLKSLLFKIGQFFFRIIFVFIAYPLVYMRYHIKVEGREHLKEYEKELKKRGFITVSNHVFLWDFVALCASLRMGFPNVPAWGKITYSKFGQIFSLAGVIPIPDDQGVFKKFYKFLEGILSKNKWVHVYPETGLWYLYVPIRPFKRGAAMFAYQYDKPIIPVGYSFRERKGLAKIFRFKKSDPLITVHISKPIWPDLTLPKRESVELLTEQARTAVMHSVGIMSEEENEKLKENYEYENGHIYTKL